MKKLLTAVALLMTFAAVLTACGGSEDDGPLDQEALAAQADAICSETNLLYDDLGIRGISNTGVVAEMTGTTEIADGQLADLEELEVEADLQKDWDAYLSAVTEAVETDRQIVADAKADDTDAVNAGFEKLGGPIYEERQKIAKELGLEVCSNPDVPIETELTSTGPADDVTYAEPKNTVADAADAWVAATKSGNCDDINALFHVDAGEWDEATCKATSKNFADAEVVESEQYGPVGTAEIVASDTHYPTMFVEDLDGDLKTTVSVVHDSAGLRPAPEDNDADETAAAAVTALADGDAEVLTATVFEPDEEGSFKETEDGFTSIGSGKFGPAFVKDVQDERPEPQPLGINATWAFYLVEGSENDWVINLVHNPGAGGNYKFAGYWPVPKAE
ncbi:MAG: hypothetical protein ACSLFD_06790 [Solirubrobacterales bacterium]